MYICVPCGARLNRLVCNGPVSPLDIIPFCFAVLSRFVCHSVRKYTLLGLVYLVLLVLSLAISPPPLFRNSIPERLETKATTSSTFGHVHDVPVGAEV